MLRSLCSFFAWRIAYDTGSWVYSENIITGERRACRREGRAFQPLDEVWVAGGEWDVPLPPGPIDFGGGVKVTPPRHLKGHLLPFVAHGTVVLQHLDRDQPGWMK